MKKILLSTLLLGSIALGQEHIQPDRMKNMQEMEIALSTIQKGFLYKNINVVKNGVKNLKDRVFHKRRCDKRWGKYSSFCKKTSQRHYCTGRQNSSII